MQQAGKALEVQSSLSVTALQGGMGSGRGSERRLNDVYDHFELIFVRKGVLPIQAEEQAFEVGAGQSFLLWPERAHAAPENGSSDLYFFWLQFQMKEALLELPLNAEQSVGVPQHATVSRPAWLESLFYRYLDDQEAGRLLPPYANVLAWLMLFEVADPRPEPKAEWRVEEAARRAFSYIHSHCHLPLSASKIAGQLGYNPQYLTRVFRQTYHRTLTEEIHQARIARARHLLLDSSLSASEIAHACGFASVNYFFRLFKRYEGITPQAFRRLHVPGRDDSE